MYGRARRGLHGGAVHMHTLKSRKSQQSAHTSPRRRRVSAFSRATPTVRGWPAAGATHPAYFLSTFFTTLSFHSVSYDSSSFSWKRSPSSPSLGRQYSQTERSVGRTTPASASRARRCRRSRRRARRPRRRARRTRRPCGAAAPCGARLLLFLNQI